MAKPEFDIVIIGGGAGGLVVAAGGAALGAKVAVVEKHKLGGDCLWYGCVPSKTLLKSARVAHEMRHADRWALTPAAPQPDLARVMERVAGVIKGIEPHDSPERFRGLGVDVVFGDGRFVGPDAFEVDGRRLTASTFVIATGSRPAVPKLPGLDTTPYLTNETVFDLREPVPSLVVVGAGPIGCEMAQAFRRLGSEVTVVDIAPQILPREDADLATVVFDALQGEGVRFRLGASITGIAGRKGDVRVTVRTAAGTPTELAGSHLLLAAGRTANVDGLGLDAAGVALDQGRIVANGGLRTTNPKIYVIGDAAGGYQFTHVAEHHAGIVLRQALFRMRWAKPSPVVPWCTFTDPELARVGLSETEAGQRGRRASRLPVRVRRDRSRARRERDRGVREDRHRSERPTARRGHRRAARRRADRGIRARLVEGDERQGPDRGHSRVPDAGADQPPRRRSTPEGGPHTDGEDVDPADLRPAGGARMSSDAPPQGKPTEPAPGAIRGHGGKIALVVVLVAVVAAFFALDGQRYLSLEAVKANRDGLLRFADEHFVLALVIAFLAYAGAVAFSLPGGLVLSLTMGFIFGRWVGTVLVVFAATVGATLVFLAARYLFADAARRRLGALGERINAGFTENAFNYLLFLRLVPLFPFFLVNLAPAFTTISLRTYVLGTLIGIIPGDVRLRESRPDARPHRFAVGARLDRDHRRLRAAGTLRAGAGVRPEIPLGAGRQGMIGDAEISGTAGTIAFCGCPSDNIAAVAVPVATHQTQGLITPCMQRSPC